MPPSSIQKKEQRAQQPSHPPPKYTPPEKATQEVASTSIFHAASPEQPSVSASRSPKELYSNCDLKTLHDQQDENKYKKISIKVPRGMRKILVIILHPMFNIAHLN